MYSMFLLLAGGILGLIVYYYAYPFWAAVGLRSSLTDSLMLEIYHSGTFTSQLSVKLVCLFFATVSVVVRSGSSKDSSWAQVLVPLLSGLAAFFGSGLLGNGWGFVFATLTGFSLYLIGAILLGRKIRSFDAHLPDYWDTFPQCEEKIAHEFSANIPTTYH